MTSVRPTDVLVDTSVAVALAVADHTHHTATADALTGRRPGLAGHAAFEVFSVLTRLPPPLRLGTHAAFELLSRNFPASLFLSAQGGQRLLAQLPSMAVAGGAVYDALVGATAVERRLTLVTRDRRALATYRALAVDVELLA